MLNATIPVIVVLLLSVTGSSAFNLVDIVKGFEVTDGTLSLPQIALRFVETIKSKTELFSLKYNRVKPSEFPYFNFIPIPKANVVPDAAKVEWVGTCYANNFAMAKTKSDGNVQIEFTVTGMPTEIGCYDHYLLLTVTGVQALKLDKPGVTTVDWAVDVDFSDSERWDLAEKGIRIMHFATDQETTLANIVETALLFVPEFTQGVDKHSAQRNVEFLQSYPQFSMMPRDPLDALPPPANEVHSGDFFGMIRLDGLDPMLAWAMGSTTGHTTIAMWFDDELYICESTITSSYWPTNGIQKTPYSVWLKQAQQAGYNVVYAPLNDEARKSFNVEAAVKFFQSVQGLDYGFNNLFWGWLDTVSENYPCIPADYSSVCLTWELVETLFAVIDRSASAISDQMWNQAWNKRLGTVGLNTADLYYEAYKQGRTSNTIPTIVEQDEWLYNTTRYGEPAEGPAMVCCVFVCQMWKAAGVFGDLDFNCAELTNVDDYGLTLFDSERTHQILGQWTLELNRFNSKSPYAHMGETCASLAPDFEQDPHC